MKRIYFLFFFVAHVLHAQKIIKKSVVEPEIEFITLDVANSFKLFIDTAPGNEMALEATIDGEYSDDLMVNIRQSGSTLLVDTEFQPNFRKPNDKLSAHKVISIALKVVLPEQKNVTIYGTGCHITAKGKYKTLKITLNDGMCDLESVTGVAEVATKSGAISVLAKSAKIEATTKFGKVGRNPIPLGNTYYNVRSITGDIYLDKIE